MKVNRLIYLYATYLCISVSTVLAIDADQAIKQEYLNDLQKLQLTAAMIEESNKVYSCESPELVGREINHSLAPIIINDQTVKKGIVHERWEVEACDKNFVMFYVVCNDPIDSGFLLFESSSFEPRKGDIKNSDPIITEQHCY